MSLTQLHTQYLLYLYLSTISCIYSLFYSTISCVLPRPLTPQPFILCILRYVGTISCVDPISCSLCWISTISWILIRSCINCYISPLRPSAHTAAYNAHNLCRRRETRYLAFYWLPVKSHRPKPSRAILSVLQYLVLYTIHQPQYIVVSNGAMNLCILHKYLNYNILCYKATMPTIYSRATRSARFAVSRALCIYRCSLPAACETCDTAQLSPARAMLRTAAVAVQRTAHDTEYSLDYVQIAQKQAKK